ncbi:MAG TPA: uracil-DNA glycosylase, partial [Gemmatimonadales bacterium]
GIDADCLFLLEAPGPRAVESGFVSRNNPDETAKSFMLLNEAAGIARSRTVVWNIVPWYIGSGQRIRPATGKDIDEGWPYVVRLLDLLPRVAVAVLVGRKAQRVRRHFVALRPDVAVFDCPHPSPLFVNRLPANREVVVEALRAVAAALPGRLYAPGAA